MSEWQPIETAPKDGVKRVFLWGSYVGWPVAGPLAETGVYDDGPAKAWFCSGGYEFIPTHWKRIDPPKDIREGTR